MTVRLIATGGTIASLADPETGAVRPAVSAEDLVRTVPGLGEVEVEQVAHVNGWNVTPATMLDVARRAAVRGGVVVTHGTDTIEETAFLCDLTVEGDVVFAGAMRNGSEVSADGPRNLLCASQVADAVHGLGTVLVLNDEIHAARWARKQDSSRVSAFTSPGHGPVGFVVPGSVRITMPPPKRLLLPLPDALPPVALIQTYTGMEEGLIEAVLDATDARGLVLEGTGLGNVPGSAEPGIRAALARGLPGRRGHARADRRHRRRLRRPRRRGHAARARRARGGPAPGRQGAAAAHAPARLGRRRGAAVRGGGRDGLRLGGAMIAEEERFAAELARAVAEDVRAHAPAGELVRIIVRWFEAADPLYFTVHALGEDEAQEVPADDAWYPLEWPNLDDELERSERVAEDPGVVEAGEALAAAYAEAEEEEPQPQEDGEWTPSLAIVEAVRLMADALRGAGVPLAERFAASAAHSEGWGVLKVLEATADSDALHALEEQDELPHE